MTLTFSAGPLQLKSFTRSDLITDLLEFQASSRQKHASDQTKKQEEHAAAAVERKERKIVASQPS